MIIKETRNNFNEQTKKLTVLECYIPYVDIYVHTMMNINDKGYTCFP